MGPGKVGETGKAGLHMLYRVNQPWRTGLYQTTIFNLVSGRKCAPSSNFCNYLLEHNSLIHWRLHVLIFLECWICFPQ